MKRELDLGPDEAPSIGSIQLAANPRRMAITRSPVRTGGPVEIQQPFQIVVVGTTPTGRNRREPSWCVTLEREGYSLPIKTRRSQRRAVAIALLLAGAMACREFQVRTMETPDWDNDLREFFSSTRGQNGVICRLTDEMLDQRTTEDARSMEEAFCGLLGVERGEDI